MDELIERLNKHADDYANGNAQDFEKVFMDCKIAADMLKTLKTSKHTQKRRRQRLSKKNKKIEELTSELNHIKE